MALDLLSVPSQPEEPLPTPSEVTRVPTGVPDFDYFMGGVPAGSVVLLIGDAGAGAAEFALTSAVRLMLHQEDPQTNAFHLGSAKGPFEYPERILYVSLTRSRQQVVNEVREAFDETYPEVFSRHLTFEDLSSAYFQGTSVPSLWAKVPSPLSTLSPVGPRASLGPLSALAEALERGGSQAITVGDSLGDLAIRSGADGGELVTFLKGLRRRAKEWRGIVYLLLARGVASPAIEQAVVDSVDGVLSFRWSSSPSRSRRQRSLEIEKFMPVLSHVDEDYPGRFVIRVHAQTGLVTTQHERI